MTDHPHIHDDGLSPAARTALAALRAEDELAAEVKDRMWQRLAAAAASDDLPDMSHGAGRKDQARRRGALVGLAIAAGLTLTVLGLQRAAQPVARAERGEAAAYGGSAAAERAARSNGAAASSPATPVPQDMSPTTARDDDPPAAPRRKASTPEIDKRDAAPEASASALAAEAALLQRAQTAHAAGDDVAALGLLDQHAREYADGALAQERAALRVVALCAAGREDEGRAAAASFLRAHPGSVLAERVRGACEGG